MNIYHYDDGSDHDYYIRAKSNEEAKERLINYLKIENSYYANETLSIIAKGKYRLEIYPNDIIHSYVGW